MKARPICNRRFTIGGVWTLLRILARQGRIAIGKPQCLPWPWEISTPTAFRISSGFLSALDSLQRGGLVALTSQTSKIRTRYLGFAASDNFLGIFLTYPKRRF